MFLRPYQIDVITDARSAIQGVRSNVIVYALVEPATMEIRYIGKTVRGVQRILEHTQGATMAREQTWKARWIRDLLRRGLTPIVQVLSCCVREEDLDACEIAWIAFGRAERWPLTNLTDGGEGALHPSKETIEKRRMSMMGHPTTAETRAKIGAANKIAHQSPETKARMRIVIAASKTPAAIEKLRASLTGKHPSNETRAKLSAWQSNRPPRSFESRQKISVSNKGRSVTPETRAKLSASLRGRVGERRCPRLTIDVAMEIIRMGAEGATHNAIAVANGTSISSVGRVLDGSARILKMK